MSKHIDKNPDEEIAPEDDLTISTTTIKYNFSNEDHPYMFSFKTPARISVTIYTTMIDHINGLILPSTVDPQCLCWYCRSKIAPFSPLGCPISYTSAQDKKPEIFITDGMFHSIPCIRSFIEDNIRNPLYKDSLTLLSILHHRLTGFVLDIPRAPSWKLLVHNGGKMTVDDYNSQFSKSYFFTTDNVAYAPRMSTIGTYIERKSKYSNG